VNRLAWHVWSVVGCLLVLSLFSTHGQLPPPRIVRDADELGTYKGVANFYKGGSLYKVFVWLDSTPRPEGEMILEATYGAMNDADLGGLLRMIAIHYGTRKGQVFRVSVWDPIKDRWHHPGGITMREDWDGMLPVDLDARVGSGHY
jgi:hypothetical protein